MTASGPLYDWCMHPLETWGGLARRRAFLVPQAHGEVLEVGAGTGANLPFYAPARVRRLQLLDRVLPPRLAKRAAAGPIPLHLCESDVEALPFADATFDTVVFTLVFCTVPDPRRGLAEIRRVLRPGGTVLFLEHGLPERRPQLQRLLRALTPTWRLLAGGCHLDRDPLANLRLAGFAVEEVEIFGRGLLVAGRATHAPD